MRFVPSLLFISLLFSGLSAQEAIVPAYELDHRIQLSVDRLTDLDRYPAFTHDFLLADVRLNPADPRRFYNFSGDLSGRYLEVMSLLPAEQARVARLPELVAAILEQQRPDGRFGDDQLQYVADEIGGEHMALLWGNGRLLVGLMTYYGVHRDPAVLAAARRLGEFFIQTAASCREPEIRKRLEGFGAKGIICFTQYIEGLVMLARATGEEKFTQASVDAYTILPSRGVQHSHGYLSTLRGVLMLYELTGDAARLRYVRQTTDELLASEDHTMYGGVLEYFGGMDDKKGKRDEGCSSADFVRLLLHLHQITGEERYLKAGEKGLYNALFYNQYANGDFGHHYFVDHGVLPTNPRRAWWCCTMHGLRALLAVKNDFSFVTTEDGASEIRLLLPQRFEGADQAFTLEALPTVADGKEGFELSITRWKDGPLLIRLPEWASEWDLPGIGEAENGLYRIDRVPVGGKLLLRCRFNRSFSRSGSDTPEAELPEEPTSGWLTYGPYILGANQDEFIAEPDWGNQVLLTEARPSPTVTHSLETVFRHSGYPGRQPLRLVPIAHQLYYDHPYMRVKTNYTRRIAPRPSE